MMQPGFSYPKQKPDERWAMAVSLCEVDILHFALTCHAQAVGRTALNLVNEIPNHLRELPSSWGAVDPPQP